MILRGKETVEERKGVREIGNCNTVHFVHTVFVYIHTRTDGCYSFLGEVHRIRSRTKLTINTVRAVRYCNLTAIKRNIDAIPEWTWCDECRCASGALAGEFH